MKSRKKQIAVIALTIAVLFGVAITSVFASDLLLAQSGSESTYKTKYEKPAIGDITNEDAYPDEITSDASVGAEKAWYEYITYSDTPIYDPIEIATESGMVRVTYYDPLDYSYGLIMEADTSSDTNTFSSSNEKKITVKKTNSFKVESSTSVGYEDKLTATITATAGTGLKTVPWAEVGSEIKTELTKTLDINVTITDFEETVEEKTETYNAVYFNSDGSPYQWKLVSYRVLLPLKCKVEFKKNGEWIDSGDYAYCLLTTVQGTCRQWIEGDQQYIEHWGTGERVSVEGFWEGFFTVDKLKEAYTNQALPKN